MQKYPSIILTSTKSYKIRCYGLNTKAKTMEKGND
jgi:hypothetical protein